MKLAEVRSWTKCGSPVARFMLPLSSRRGSSRSFIMPNERPLKPGRYELLFHPMQNLRHRHAGDPSSNRRWRRGHGHHGADVTGYARTTKSSLPAPSGATITSCSTSMSPIGMYGRAAGVPPRCANRLPGRRRQRVSRPGSARRPRAGVFAMRPRPHANRSALCRA